EGRVGVKARAKGGGDPMFPGAPALAVAIGVLPGAEAAVGGDGHVLREGAARYRGGGEGILDGAATACPAVRTTEGLVAEEHAADDGGVRVKQVLDGAAGTCPAARTTDGLVVGELAVRESRTRTEFIIEGTPAGEN